MTQGGPAEKRQSRRIVAQVPIRFGVEGRICDGVMVDFSDGGIQIRSADSFATGVVLDVFIQFPRRRLRLRARVAWVHGDPPTMGLSFVQPDRSLAAAYGEWVEESGWQHAGASRDSTPQVAPDTPRAPGTGSAPLAVRGAAAPQPAVPEPAGPVVRHLETTGGNQYDIRIEKEQTGWRLLIYPSPGSFPTPRPEVDQAFPDYASADSALREFLRSH
jgi:hypothetical protein